MLYALFVILAADFLTTPTRYPGDAALLFQDGRQRLQAGRYGTAALAFRALISVYPDSPLVDQARELMRESRELDDLQEHAAVVRSIRFVKLTQVTPREILERFREREVGLAVEERCVPRDFDAAKTVVEELLAEKGVQHPRVKVAARQNAAHLVDVTIHAH